MIKQSDLSAARELKERLAEFVPLVDFRVFGSRARGEGDEYSDMDVFIEVENIDKGLKRAIRDAVWETGFNHSLYISPLIFTRHELEHTPLRASPIIRNINEEGVKV